jgi:hypothetical protein
MTAPAPVDHVAGEEISPDVGSHDRSSCAVSVRFSTIRRMLDVLRRPCLRAGRFELACQPAERNYSPQLPQT